MSVRLRTLIRGVRECKTAAEEREVIAKESAALREAFRDPEAVGYRHRNVAKLMFIHMLGYPTHFGQMETMKLIASAGFAEKRMGYLGLMILLDERHEVLMLVTNSIKMDMNSKNPYIAGLALAALGNICSAEMARDLAPDIERILEGGPPYLRKKAALCAIRILKKVPDLVEQFVDRAASLLKAHDGAVQLSGVALMMQILKTDSSVVDAYRMHVPALCSLLKRLLQPGAVPAEYDVAGIANPFLQVKTLKLLRLLGQGHAESSDMMSDILAQVASNIDTSRNAGNAVLYECVQTIMGIESMGGLRVLAVNALAKFLGNRDNNMRYVALNTLAKVVAVDGQAVQRHRATIVECVKDADVSIRRRALELVYGLVNESNIRTLTRELLDYLAVCDSEFKPDLTAKICTLIQRFAPDKRWHFDSLLQVMTQAGAYVKDEVCRALIVLITNAPELHGYAVRNLYRNLLAYQDVAEHSLSVTALWCIGEFGEMLVPGGGGGALLEGELPLVASDKEIVDLVALVTLRRNNDMDVKDFGLTTAMKLTARFPAQVPRLQALMSKGLRSPALEPQTRSAEYTRMFKLDANVRAQLMERMPALDESEYWAHLHGAADAAGVQRANGTHGGSSGGGAAEGVPSGPAAAAAAAASAAAQAAKPPPSPIDLLGDLDLTTPVPARPAGTDVLSDLLGGPLSPTPASGAQPATAAAAPAAAAAGGLDIMDLLGGPAPAATAATQPAAPPAQAEAASPFPPQVVHQKDGLSIRFAYQKPQGPDVTLITATCTNFGATPITGFSLQAAVPKFITLRLEPASSTTIPASSAGSVTQKIWLTNTLHGTKPLALRLRLTYAGAGGQQAVEQVTIDNMPAGL